MPNKTSEQSIVSAVSREFMTAPVKATRDAIAVVAAIIGAVVLVVTHADISLKIAGVCGLLICTFVSLVKPTYRMLRGGHYASKELGMIFLTAIATATIAPMIGPAYLIDKIVHLQGNLIETFRDHDQVMRKVISNLASITAEGLEGKDQAAESSVQKLKELATAIAPTKDSTSEPGRRVQIADMALIFSAVLMHLCAIGTLAACAYSLSHRCTLDKVEAIPLQSG